MNTIEEILQQNEKEMIPTYTGKYWGTGTVIDMMREYAKKECINFLKELREYQIDISDGKDPFHEGMDNEELYQIYQDGE